MPNHNLIVVTVEEHPQLSLDELCSACGVTPEFIQSLIEYGIVEPISFSQDVWHFDARDVRRIRTILRLQHDLEVNIAGAALVLDLMDQMEKMRTQIELFDKHFKWM